MVFYRQRHALLRLALGLHLTPYRKEDHDQELKDTVWRPGVIQANHPVEQPSIVACRHTRRCTS
jgi:hypothetical protein